MANEFDTANCATFSCEIEIFSNLKKETIPQKPKLKDISQMFSGFSKEVNSHHLMRAKKVYSQLDSVTVSFCHLFLALGLGAMKLSPVIADTHNTLVGNFHSVCKHAQFSGPRLRMVSGWIAASSL